MSAELLAYYHWLDESLRPGYEGQQKMGVPEGWNHRASLCEVRSVSTRGASISE